MQKDQACYMLALALVAGGSSLGDLSKIIGRTIGTTTVLASDPITRSYVASIQREIADRIMAIKVQDILKQSYSAIPIQDTIQQVVAAHTVKEARRQRRRRGSAPADSGAPGQDTGQDQDAQDTQDQAGIEAD